MTSAKLDLGTEHNIAIIRVVHDTHRSEMNYHREAMNKVYQWATNLYLAIAGGLVVLASDKLDLLDCSSRAFIIFAIILVTFFVVAQLRHSADAINSNALIVVKADRIMKLFEKDYFVKDDSIYPEKWENWGEKKGAGYYEKFHIILCIFLAIALCILSIII